MRSAGEYALRMVAAGRVVACIPGVNADGEPCVRVPELEPSPEGRVVAVHPDRDVRAGFLTGVIIGLHRYCERQPDFTPGTLDHA